MTRKPGLMAIAAAIVAVSVLSAAWPALARPPAGRQAQNHTMACVVPKAPLVDVKLSTDPISYDFSQNAAALGMMGSNTVSPYAPGMDTVSGGLREDHPTVKTDVSWRIKYNEQTKVACLWYDTITIQIKLSPKIYVAREFNSGICREAILQHERRHVDVDRLVINKYARNMGEAVRAAVDNAGAVGPFNYTDLEEMKSLSARHIESAVDSQNLLMQKEMRALQGQVDSLEEYEKISKQCRDVKLRK